MTVLRYSEGLEAHFARDLRLRAVNDAAKEFYDRANLEVHNYDHALWDTEQIVRILGQEPHPAPSLPIAAGLMHDTGVAIGPYKDHNANSAVLVRRNLSKLGFPTQDVEEIATAVSEHNGNNHTSLTSRILYDADTLNKAGVHGIGQCELVAKERNLDLAGMRDRFLGYFQGLVTKGLYTQAARTINTEMGNDTLPDGLQLTLNYWTQIDEHLRAGRLPETEIIKRVNAALGIQRYTGTKS